MSRIDWFDEWSVVPLGPGGDQRGLACPRANRERPDRTPACVIEIPARATIATLRQTAREHRLRHARGDI